MNYQIIKNGEHNRAIVLTHDSPSFTVKIAEKLNKRARRLKSGASYSVDSPVCPVCQAPFVAVEGGGWGYCYCE